MNLKDCEVFGRLAIKPVTIRKPGGLVIPETGGMKALRVGYCLEGSLKGEYIIYRTSTEERGDYHGAQYWFIPVDAAFATLALDDDDIVEDLIVVDRHVGEDRGWYGG